MISAHALGRLLLLVLLVAALAVTYGAFDMFLKIEGIKGESQDATHKDSIEVTAFAHAVLQPSGSVANVGGRGGSGVTHGDLVVAKHHDAATLYYISTAPKASMPRRPFSTALSPPPTSSCATASSSRMWS